VTTPPPAPPPPPPPSVPSGAWGAVPSAAPVERIRAAYARRNETDYYFSNIGLDIFLTIITLNIYGLFVFYQLMRRMRDHNRRRLDLLDATNDFAWQQANERGVAEELRPNFERISTHLSVLRQMTTDFRDPTVWLVIVIGVSVIGSGLGFIPWMIGLIVLDGDLIKHDQAEGAVEAELSAIFNRLGQNVPAPDPARLKGKQNYPGRIVATVFTCTIYGYWWQANAMRDGNTHFQWNWPWEDALAGAVQALEPAA
jgi:hypothetical protein